VEGEGVSEERGGEGTREVTKREDRGTFEERHGEEKPERR